MVRIVTDSTSDISPADAARLGVDVVPLTVRFGEETFLDGVDITPDAFYARLATAPLSPSTSQPTPQRFAEIYQRHVDAGETVVSVHISEKLSGTLQSAVLAARDFAPGVIHTVDSMSVSAGLAFLVRAALFDVAEGCDAATVVARMTERRRRVTVYVLLDTLTYLQRGGRIGRAQGMVGGILKVKPLLRIAGEVHPQARVRSRQQGIDRMLELVRGAGHVDQLAAFHCGAPELLDLVVPALREMHPEVEPMTGELGAVVGTYSGPGGIGVAHLTSAIG
ncbi:MAG: DegV family protein [Candidatus Dormibacteria bacterium]